MNLQNSKQIQGQHSQALQQELNSYYSGHFSRITKQGQNAKFKIQINSQIIQNIVLIRLTQISQLIRDHSKYKIVAIFSEDNLVDGEAAKQMISELLGEQKRSKYYLLVRHEQRAGFLGFSDFGTIKLLAPIEYLRFAQNLVRYQLFSDTIQDEFIIT